MSLLDAKVIDTQDGLEVYLDRINTVEIITIYHHNTNVSSFEIKLGVNYFLLREGSFESRKKYFWIRLNDHNSSITLMEPETESILAVKDEVGRKLIKDLIETWVIKTNTFNQAIIQQVQKLKKEKNIQTEDDIKRLSGAIKSLEKLVQVQTEDIQRAPIEKRYSAAMG